MILLIDTSLVGKIGFSVESNSIYVSSEKQSVDLSVECEKFLKENNLTFKDISVIGAVVGPGSFTGIRIGIAYAKGLCLGLGVPLYGINAFEIYMESAPDAFVAIDSGREDLFVAAADLAPTTMSIEEIEKKQFDYKRTIGHKPYDLQDGLKVLQKKIDAGVNETVIPLYLRPHYAEVKNV